MILVNRSVKIFIFIGLIILALWIGPVLSENNIVKEAIVQYGYVGIFFGSLLGGLSIFAPIPIVAFFPLFIDSGLNPVLIVSIAVLGVTITDMLVYYFGRLGKHLSPSHVQKKANKLTKFLEDYHKISLVALFFFAAFVPFPNELLIVPMAFLGYRAYSLFVAILLGNTVFTIISIAGVISIIG